MWPCAVSPMIQNYMVLTENGISKNILRYLPQYASGIQETDLELHTSVAMYEQPGHERILKESMSNYSGKYYIEFSKYLPQSFRHVMT